MMDTVNQVIEVVLPHLDTVFMILAGIVALTPTELDDTVVARMRHLLQKLGVLKKSEKEVKKEEAVKVALAKVDAEEEAES